MTDQDFRHLVRDMRRAQRDYFQHRRPELLRAARDYERRVDRELDPAPRTDRLFESDER